MQASQQLGRLWDISRSYFMFSYSSYIALDSYGPKGWIFNIL